MSAYNLPTPYELSRIAAALQGAVAGEKPAEAVRDALRLWYAAAAELNAKEVELRSVSEGRSQQAENPVEELIWMIENKEGSQEAYPAMEWINARAHKRDQFKTFAAFKKAWLKFDSSTNSTERFYFSWRTYELERFLIYRQEQRRKPDAARKRTKRALENAAPEEVSKKNSAGQTVKSKHK